MAAGFLILLVGGRLQPVTLFAVSQQPQVVAIVASQDSKRQAEDAIKRLSQLLPGAEILDPVYVHPYRPGQTAAAVEALLRREEATGLDPSISLTSAPAPMTIGAYEVAKRRGCPAYYLITSANEVLDFAGENEVARLRLWVTVPQYLANLGLDIAPHQKPRLTPNLSVEEQLVVCRYFVEHAEVSADVLDWLRSQSHRPDQKLVPGLLTKKWPRRLGQKHWDILEMLASHGLIDHLTHPAQDRDVSFHLPDEASIEFLKGDWLELYFYEEAKAATFDNGPLFDDVRPRLRIHSQGTEREIDFIGIGRGIALIGSCKTGQEGWNKSALDEVAAVGRMLGENYCTKLLVTNRPRPSRQDHQYDKFMTVAKQAEEQRVRLVSGEELADLRSLLQNELENPTYPRR